MNYDIRAQIYQLKRLLFTVEDEKEELEMKFEQTQKDFINLKQEKDFVEEEKTILESELNELQQKDEVLQEKVKMLEEELNKEREIAKHGENEKIAEYQRQIEAQNKNILELKKEINSLKSKNEVVESKVIFFCNEFCRHDKNFFPMFCRHDVKRYINVIITHIVYFQDRSIRSKSKIEPTRISC
jgi:predicted  nucleic acid-binding Zn-ribbon protein